MDSSPTDIGSTFFDDPSGESKQACVCLFVRVHILRASVVILIVFIVLTAIVRHL